MDRIGPQLKVNARPNKFAEEAPSPKLKRFFSDNTQFLGSTLSQKPLTALQLHVEWVLRNGMWLALSTRQSLGGETSINGLSKDDRQFNNRVGASLSYPVSPHNTLRVALTTGLTTSIGNDYTSFYVTWVYGWITGHK